MRCNCITFFLVVPLEQFLAPGQHGALCLELGETGERDHNEKTYWDILRYTEILYLELFGYVFQCSSFFMCMFNHVHIFSDGQLPTALNPGTMLGGWLCDVCPIKLAMSCCIGSSSEPIGCSEIGQNIKIQRIQDICGWLSFFFVFPTGIKQFLSEVWGVTRRSEWFHQFCALLWRGSALSVIAVPFSASTGNAWVLQLGLFFRPKNGVNWSAIRLWAFEMRQWHQGVFKLSQGRLSLSISLLTERASLNYFKSRVLDYPQPYPKDILQEITQQLHNQTSISGQPTSFFSVAWALPWFPSQSLLPAGASLGRRQDPPNPAGPPWRKA